MTKQSIQNSMLKASVNGFYSMQKTRIRVGNNVVANFKIKLGQEPSASENTLDADAKLLLSNLRVSYKKITDGVVKPRKFKQDGLISEYGELALLKQYFDLVEAEENALKQITYSVSSSPSIKHS